MNIIAEFLHIYFWVFLVSSVGVAMHGVYLKSKGVEPKRHGLLETSIALTLFILSFWY